jgi:DNA-binding transcriptional ArsR family regulator
MGFWQIGVDELARSRFAVSPLSEAVAALTALARAHPLAGMRDWLEAHTPAYRERLAADPSDLALVRAALRPRWIAHVLAVPPHRGDRTFYDELRHVRDMPIAVALHDLAPGESLPPELTAPDVPRRAADLLEWVWTETVRPDWPRRRRIFEADIVSRTARLGSGGWAAALDGLRRGMRWLDDGRLQINAYANPPRAIADAELTFIPTTSPTGWVGWDEPHRYTVIYPCSGFLADPPLEDSPQALAKLIGPVRARILTQLSEPRSTSQLVALTGYTLGSVGGHLKILLDAGLVDRRRAGRSVLYYRTQLGRRLASPSRAQVR